MVVVSEVLLLRPRGGDDTGPWPMFVMVVSRPTERAPALAMPLFELLDRPKRPNELSMVAVKSTWSVLDPANALLTMSVRGAVPFSFDLRIILPAAPVLDVLDVAARGDAIGITTRDHADRLRGRVDIGTALRNVVLLSCPPSVELADLASLLRAAREE